MPLIWNGAFRGLADSKFSGVEGSFAECVGIDGNSTPGLLKVHQKLTLETTGTEPDELCKVAIAASNGYSFWFSSISGKIWARNSSGTWSLALTTTAAAGDVFCLGAIEYNGFIYWATQSRLHRIAIANADDAWASEVLNWATFAVTDASWHPMVIQDATLFIGDGNRVCSVNDQGTFDNNALDIKTPYRIKTMITYELDVLIGTYVADTVNKTEVLKWDTVSPSWNTSDPIEEVGINAFIRDDNRMLVNAGRAGNIYLYDGEKLHPHKRIPGTYSNTAYGYVHPNSVGNFKGLPVFGFSNGSGNPASQGVYTLGSYSKDYPRLLDLTFVNSQDKVATQEMGAILVLDFDLMVAWKDSSNYGVDAIDYSNKYASAYFETTMLLQKDRDKLKTLSEVAVFYNSLPADTNITFSYSVNGASYVAMTSVTDAILNKVFAELSVENIGSLQIKVTFTVSSNNAPTMEALGVEIS